MSAQNVPVVCDGSRTQQHNVHLQRSGDVAQGLNSWIANLALLNIPNVGFGEVGRCRHVLQGHATILAEGFNDLTKACHDFARLLMTGDYGQADRLGHVWWVAVA